MVTNDERREVAARLRNFEQLRGVFRVSNVCAFCDVLGVGYMDWEHICARLADLMEPGPERTCHLVIEDETGVCSNCGEDIDGYGWSYCPSCGAKVVG